MSDDQFTALMVEVRAIRAAVEAGAAAQERSADASKRVGDTTHRILDRVTDGVSVYEPMMLFIDPSESSDQPSEHRN